MAEWIVPHTATAVTYVRPAMVALAHHDPREFSMATSATYCRLLLSYRLPDCTPLIYCNIRSCRLTANVVSSFHDVGHLFVTNCDHPCGQRKSRSGVSRLLQAALDGER